MRILQAFLTALLLSGSIAVPAWSDEPVNPPVAATKEARLDQLFIDLKRERNEKAAERIAGRIWGEWSQSGSASIDLMMQWSQKAIENQKFDVALDFLDQVVTLQPNYAEGWNRRATVHFMMKNLGKSMSDIDHALQLEPRHFGALSGLAQIMALTGHKQSALEAWQKVLAIYPMMRNAQDQVATLSEELAGEGI
ncbi:tetratricopeptide repeat protein [Mesorhizobium shangrilense]|uniref:Tetratricopeptide repeat protein n=1 Tax=Mesorhizobium shangrilense TaxID=460060 RepID=A0ABV2DRK2_9HYPH